MTIMSQNWARALFPGLKMWYGHSYDEHPVQYKDLFDEETSTRAYEEIMGTTGFGLAAIKTESGSVRYTDDSQAFLSRFAHLVYGLGFTISRELVEDDQYGMVGKRRSTKLGFAIRQTQEIVHANIYNRAFNSSYAGGDGKEMIATDHPNFAGGTWSNKLATASDISEAALEQACIDIMRWEDDSGNKIAIKPQTLHIAPEQVFEARRLFESPYRPGTADNDVNTLVGMFPGGVKVNHYFTDTDAWFIRTQVPSGTGMISFLRRKQELTEDNSFDTEVAKYKATIRFCAGWGDPKAIYGSPGA
jgi:phage major head subunit gpT-like protein